MKIICACLNQRKLFFLCLSKLISWFSGISHSIDTAPQHNTDVCLKISLSVAVCVRRAVEPYLPIAIMIIIIARRKPNRPKNVCARNSRTIKNVKKHVIENVIYAAYHISPIWAIQKRHQQHTTTTTGINRSTVSHTVRNVICTRERIKWNSISSVDFMKSKKKKKSPQLQVQSTNKQNFRKNFSIGSNFS